MGTARDQRARTPHPGADQAEDIFKDAPLAWSVSGSNTPKVETLTSSAMDCHLGAVAYSASPRARSALIRRWLNGFAVQLRWRAREHRARFAQDAKAPRFGKRVGLAGG